MPFHYFESKPKWIWIIITIITSLAMIGGALAISQSAFDSKYADLGKLILSVILFLAGCLFLASLPYYYPKIKIEGNIVTINSWFIHKSFMLEEVIGFEKVAKSAEYGIVNWEELTIYWGSQKITFNSMSFNNYDELKQILTNNQKEGKPVHLIDKGSKRALIFMGIFFGGIIIWLMSYVLHPEAQLIYKENLDTVYGTLKIQPDIMRDGKSSSKLEIQLLEYPDFTFKLQGKPFEAANVSKFIHDIEENDTISINITKTDFNQKIKETEPLSFGNKYYHYDYIQVYGLGFKNNHYLSIDEHNRLENEENVWMKWVSIGVCLFLLFLLYKEAKIHFKLN